MSQTLEPIVFPLRGSRLIEASAGTGKTWTIAALYVRLVLGHGGDDGFGRPLAPAEILVMTFTRAATRELSDRVRARLVEAAHCFRGQAPQDHDGFLIELIASYPGQAERLQAAHRLMLAAEAMDECAIFTIDAWCQRMLREHAFDSGSLFDEELVSNEESLFRDAVRDYWRQQVYPLGGSALAMLLGCWDNVDALEKAMRQLVPHAGLFDDAGDESLARLIARATNEQHAVAAAFKPGWRERVERMVAWVEKHRAGLHGVKMKQSTLDACFEALRTWADGPEIIVPGAAFDAAWHRLTPAHITDCFKAKFSAEIPGDFNAIAALQAQLAAIEPLAYQIQRHAACRIAKRMMELKQRRRQFGFADMLTRLRMALEGGNGETLARRITSQYPVALIDEFQDTSPEQYSIFNRLYRIADNPDELGLFLIGDPKQAIYGFRGADIHSYLDARRATAGRHYLLGTNYRSTAAVVEAVNHLFLHAEGAPAGRDGQCGAGHAQGAFRFRRGGENPLPFEPVGAQGRAEQLVETGGAVAAMTFWCSDSPDLKSDGYREHFSALCAERIVALLDDPAAGFAEADALTPLKPADIAVLVRDRKEAAAVRRALLRRGVASVYLSDKDSVFESTVAADLLTWLQAVANPLDAGCARAAFATRSAGLSLEALAHLAADDLAWEARVEQLKALRLVWQRQGVLAMLRRFIHELDLPARLLRETGGERSLTDLLHLAEMLQAASQNLDGEHALIRWLAEQIANDGEGGDERILRLESDAELVQVITVHKSKGLEYPLVFLPFAVSAKPVNRANRSFFFHTGEDGARRVDFARTEEAREQLDRARLDEDLRLLYVALTRARHALWLGVASLKDRIHDSAMGYLLGGGEAIDGAQLMARLQAMRGDCAAISLLDATADPGFGPLSRRPRRPPLQNAPPYAASFERHWKIASYSSITRELGSAPVPATPLAEKLAEDDDLRSFGKLQDTAWHRFPRGSLPGQFLHAQLEWMANEGFGIVDDVTFESRLRARCERAGWGHRQDDAVAWLRAIAQTPLPPLGAALRDLDGAMPETEFWFPAHSVATGALDALCQRHLLDGIARASLSERELHGMLRGFKDLVFEHAGRYWVLDYKSNALAPTDAGYHRQALAEGMAACRYDVQGAIYLLALHRLLKSRLGAEYDPQAQLGGALFYFLRGINNPETRGCYHLPADVVLLEALDALLPVPAATEDFA
ncbi:exodeoxyribonuclease V subunit beta [Janthinobacterium sp. 17J80-10]|uniref:exodeoxyribonuclease V subunit beta n=1 Tax=Janthinobacterium sp. 17J80-10 TaxID=2497863 RepID=UPI001005A1C3|nr:exodeoxyribonuclease V subunit beta [Janthinobacterium sp. 17J80-10]QAU32802.1 exodeoxyribonuclease V subunit beta [Janthinobacterium sp. 17J80-10]